MKFICSSAADIYFFSTCSKLGSRIYKLERERVMEGIFIASDTDEVVYLVPPKC